MTELRGYQGDAVEGTVTEARRGAKAIMIQGPTGSGKTPVLAEIMRRATAKGNGSLFIVHRNFLVQQASNKLSDIEVDHSITLPGSHPDYTKLVQLASVQTLSRRLKHLREELDPAIIIIDEAHHAVAKTYMKIIEAFPQALIIGTTATPTRSDEVGLGSLFDALVCFPGIAALTEQGYLVPLKYYSPSMPDVANVRTQMGDYHPMDAEGVMNRAPLIGDAIEWLIKMGAQEKQFLGYAQSVAHSIALAEQARASGLRAAHIDGTTPREIREEVLEDFHSRKLDGLFSYGIFTEGYDAPEVELISVNRLTKSLLLYMQMLGRGMRPAPHINKTHTTILDHTGVTHRFGPVTAWDQWTLEPGEGIVAKKQKLSLDNAIIMCPTCRAVFPKRELEITALGTACPYCHAELGKTPPLAKHNNPDWTVMEGELWEMDLSNIRQAKYNKALTLLSDLDPEAQKRLYGELLGIAQDSGYKVGWAKHAFSEVTGKWPGTSFTAAPLPPSPLALSILRRKQREYKKLVKKQWQGI